VSKLAVTRNGRAGSFIGAAAGKRARAKLAPPRATRARAAHT